MPHRVLLVEDDFLIATLSKAMLEAIGCEVVGPVPSVERALKMIGDAQIDAAVLDVQIIGGTSIPVAEAAVAKGIPVIFVSGFADLPELPESLKHCLRLEKPVMDDELANAIYRLLGKPS
jgi:DNA-binding NtrC family response regulator